VFKITCNTFLRDNTIVTIQLPTQYRQTNSQSSSFECSSRESGTLNSNACKLKLDKSLNFVLEAEVRAIETQRQFTILVELRNPSIAKPDYRFSSNYTRKGILFASSTPGYT
jgi:hypothetical protein